MRTKAGWIGLVLAWVLWWNPGGMRGEWHPLDGGETRVECRRLLEEQIAQRLSEDESARREGDRVVSQGIQQYRCLPLGVDPRSLRG